MFSLASPHANHTVTSSLNEISFLATDTVDNGRWAKTVLFDALNAGTAVPLASVDSVVDLGDVLASSCNDSSVVELHRGDSVVVTKDVRDGAGTEIPNLR